MLPLSKRGQLCAGLPLILCAMRFSISRAAMIAAVIKVVIGPIGRESEITLAWCSSVNRHCRERTCRGQPEGVAIPFWVQSVRFCTVPPVS